MANKNFDRCLNKWIKKSDKLKQTIQYWESKYPHASSICYKEKQELAFVEQFIADLKRLLPKQ